MSTPSVATTPAGRRLLEAASTLFHRHGIGAVGVDRIAQEAGTTKKTLYDRFGSKDGLVTAYLQDRCARWQDFVVTHVATLEGAPERARGLAVLDALERWMGADRRGCGFVNAYAELAGTGHPGLAVVAAEKAWTAAQYVAALEGLGVPDAGRRGRELALVHEGALVRATAGGRDEALAEARELMTRLLDEGLAARGR